MMIDPDEVSVPCPRLKECPGSTVFAIPTCILSETLEGRPPQWARRMENPENSFWKELAIGLGSMHCTFYTYQCPCCCAYVLYMYSPRHSRFRRVADTVT